MREGGIDAPERFVILFQDGERIGAEERAVFIAVEDMDHDRPLQQSRLPVLQQDQAVDGIEGRPAGDIDEMQGRSAREGLVRGDRLGDEGRCLLRPEAHQRDVRRGGEAAVGRAVERRHQIVRPELHHIGAEPVEIGVLAVEHGGGEPRFPGEPAEQEAQEEGRDPAALPVITEKSLLAGCARHVVVGDREGGMGHIDDRQMIAGARRSEENVSHCKTRAKWREDRQRVN